MLLKLLVPTVAVAGDGGPITPFPLTGAYTATFIEDRDHVAVIELAGNYAKDLDANTLNTEPRAAVAKEYFRTHPDIYDFLVVFTDFEFDTGDAIAFYLGTQNNVQGIGLPGFDLSGLFGSDGKLQGYIDMAAMSRWNFDPLNPKFDRTLRVLAHELLHRWAAFVRFRRPDGTISSDLIGSGDTHWSYLLDTDASVEYGSEWTDNGDGTFTATGVKKFYSPLDLYLMGMYRAEEVPQLALIVNPAIDKTRLPQENATISGSKQIVTVDDIIAAEGPRIPDASNSQKEFRFAFVLLTGPDQGHTVTDTQILALNNVRKEFMTRFAVMTGGRGIAHTYPEAQPGETQGAPDTLPGGEIRTDPVNYDEALAWLRNQQHVLGYWNDKDTTRNRDTAVALGTLSKFDGQFTGGTTALDWLDEQTEENSDYLARHIVVATALGRNTLPLISELLSRQNLDGGWGIQDGFHSDPLDTALSILALSSVVSSSYEQALGNGVTYLRNTQNPDGGWSAAGGGQSRTHVTAQVLRALKAVGQQSGPSTENALTWLAGKQNPDGGFGDSPSTVHDAALALGTFVDYNALPLIQSAAVADYLLGLQGADGSWRGSAYATALAVSVLKRFAFTNLTVLEPLAATPLSPRDGERVIISGTVSNETNIPTEANLLRVYEGDPASGGMPVGADISLPVIPAGGQVSFNKVWDSFDKSGLHTFVAVADPDGTIVEMSELDNHATITVDVQPAFEGVDLEITDTDITAMPNNPDRIPIQMGISANLRNLGRQDGSNVRVVLREGETGTIVDETRLDILGRTSVVANFNYNLASPGTTKLTVQIDPDGVVQEENESNNTASIDITTLPSIDIAIAASDITLDKTPAILNDDATFTVKLHNNGTTDSPNTAVNYLVTDGNVTNTIGANSVFINAGGVITQTVTWRVNMSGSLTFTAQIDPSGLIAESDETNNNASLSFSSGSANGPNLAISYKDFTFSPVPGNEGSPETLTVLVRNTGNQDAANVVVAFYTGDPHQRGTLIGSQQTIPLISAGGETTVSVDWTQIPDSSDKLLFVVVDPADSIAESDETDNSAFDTLKVLSLPDMAVTKGDIRISPAFPSMGETVTIDVKISNLGQQTASDVLVRAYDADPGNGGVLIGENTIVSLVGNAGEVTSFSLTLDEARTPKDIFVEVNPYHTVTERIYSNNSASRSLAVQDGNLYVNPRYFSPNGDGVQDATQFFFRLAIQDTVHIEVVDESNRKVRAFAGSDFANVTSGTVTWDGLDELGRLVPDGDYLFKVIDSTGISVEEAVVTIDTNRSSLFKAVDTQYGRFTNITCELPPIYRYNESDALHFTDDEKTVFFIHRGDSNYSSGIYRMDSNGGNLKPLVPQSWFAAHGYVHARTIAISGDGQKMYFTADMNRAPYQTDVWAVSGDGKVFRQLANGAHFNSVQNTFVSPDGGKLYVVDGSTGQGIVTSFDSPYEARVVFQGNTDNSYNYYFDYAKSSGKLAVFGSSYNNPNVLDASIVDVTSGTEIKLAGGINIPSGWIDSLRWKSGWSPDGNKLAVNLVNSVSNTATITVYDASWNQLNLFDMNQYTHDMSDISWASTSDRFSVIFRLNEWENWDTYETPAPGVDPGGVYVADLTSGTLNRVASFTKYVASGQYPDSEFGTIPPPESYGAVYWAPHDNVLLYFGDRYDYFSVFLNDANRIEQVFTDLQYNNSDGVNYYGVYSYPVFLPSGSKILFEFQSTDSDSPCYQTSPDVVAFESLLNLVADLRISSSTDTGGLKIKGTATDLNFDSYLLQYAYEDTPDTWQVVAPASSEPVVDGLLATWVPPSPGRYRIRLTVNDLAGNTRTITRHTAWNEAQSITDLYRLPPYISPNGDGVQDEARIHYRVLAPVHLEFNFFDESGTRVRTITRDETLVGTEADVYWDGQDDNGIVLPDGEYRLEVQNYQFTIEIDTTNPVAEIWLPDAYQFEEIPANSGMKYVKVVTTVEWNASDKNLKESLPQYSTDLSLQGQWAELPVESGKKTRDLTFDEYLHNAYRLSTSDRAGNVNIATANPSSQQLIISGFGDLRLIYGDSGPLEEIEVALYSPMAEISPPNRTAIIGQAAARVQVVETIRDGIGYMSVQYRKASEQAWQEASVDGYLTGEYSHNLATGAVEFMTTTVIPENDIQLKFSTANLQPGESYYFRLRATDLSGNDFFSNTIRFDVGGALLIGRADKALEGKSEKCLLLGKDENKPEGYTGLICRIKEAIDDAINKLNPKVFLDQYNKLYVGTEYIDIPISKAVLYAQSLDDLRYAKWKAVDVVVNPSDQIIIFRTDNLLPCTTYNLKMELFGAENSEGLARTLGRVWDIYETPCLMVNTSTEPVFASTCGATPPGLMNVWMAPQSNRSVPLKLLTVSHNIPGVGESVVFNANKPAYIDNSANLPSDVHAWPLYFQIDTSALPEGVATYAVNVIDTNDNEETSYIYLNIDHTPPSVSLNYPADLQRACGIPTTGKDGKTYYVVTFDADISDPPPTAWRLPDENRWKYRLEIGSGATQNFVKLVHDSLNGPDSFLEAVGEPSMINWDVGFSEHMDVVGPVAQISGHSGLYSARLAVYDAGGFMQCSASTFTLDTEIEPEQPSASPALFSPDDDGIDDEVELVYGIGESATVGIDIYTASANSDDPLEITGSPVRHLESGKQILPGSSTSVWDGRNDSGGVLPDGDYLVVFDFTDGCGIRADKRLRVTLDNTPPVVSIAYPSSGVPTTMIVEVTGTVRDKHLKQYVLDYGVGEDPSNYLTLAHGEEEISEDVLHAWNTFGLTGEYTLRLRADDLAGHTSETSVLIDFSEKLNLLNKLQAVPALFSPNHDERLEITTINVGVEENILLSLEIYDAADTLVRTLLADAESGVGSHTYVWDALNDAGVAVADGDYRLRATAKLAQDISMTQEEGFTLEVDSTPPQVSVSTFDSGFVRGNSTVTGTVFDKNMKRYTLELSIEPQQPDWTQIAVGTVNLTDSPLAVLDDLAEGRYALRVTAEDKAQIVTQSVIPFEVDDTAPDIAILKPAANDVLGPKKAPVEVEVSVTEPNILAYTLNIGAGESPQTWTELIVDASLPVDMPLSVLDTTAYADGIYTLEFAAIDKAGNRAEKRQRITIDNTTPVITVTSPADGAYVKDAQEILGSVTDANLSQYKVFVASGAKDQAALWSELAAYDNTVDGSVIHRLDVLPPDGLNTFKLEARDEADNVAEYLLELIVDTQPPSVPTGLTAEADDAQNVWLIWNENPESDIAGYLIYRDGSTLLTTDPLNVTEYLDAGVDEGTHLYTVVAVDMAGWSSEQSTAIKVSIDTTPPTTSISTPADLSTVSGMQQIKGTAYSVDDFKEFRLYAADAAAPQDPILLRRSPVPTLGDVLSDWDTSGLPEGAQYLLKLEGEDINGNVATAQISVTVDNSPPAAPTGVVANAVGSDVTVEWNQSSEQDLLGYLVYRNDTLVNASGAVVGDLRSYTIAATNYADDAVVDGTYRYTVIAIDQAGNASLSSLPSEITVDTHPPHAIITNPESGAIFEKPLYLIATSDDRDIADIEFQYRITGSTAWTTFANTGAQRPYGVLLDPEELGLVYGAYDLRGVATDAGGQTDPAPETISVAYADLTPPAAVSGVMTRVTGGDVEISWAANSETDLAGYYIYRLDAGDNVSLLNATPVTEPLYQDQNLADAGYRYRIEAVDLSGNSGQASPLIDALVYTPALQQPYTPTLDAITTVHGTGLVYATVSAELITTVDTTPLPETQTDLQFGFTLPDIPLQDGVNTVAVVMTDAYGNVSKQATATVIKGQIPAKPTGVTTTTDVYDVSVSWNANPESNILGYKIFRDAQPLLSDNEIVPISADAYSNQNSAAYVLDGNSYRRWYAYLPGINPTDDQWLSVSLDQKRIVSGVDIAWYSTYYADDFDVEVWTGDAWLKLKTINGNVDGHNVIIFDSPYVTDKIRIVIHYANHSAVYLDEVRAIELGTIPELTYLDQATDGVHEYTVSALNDLGFESPRSDPATQAVGDVTAPDAVVLTASVSGADVALNWSASPSTDVSHYDVYRDGQKIFQQDDLAALAHTDSNLANGIYDYLIRAVDGAGNASLPSNTETVSVAIAPPAAPSDLVVTAAPAGSALDLIWTAGAGTAAGYNILRATNSGGPYALIGTSGATAYTDTAVTNGTTYYYVIAAFDGNGNQSTYSNEAFGVAADLTAPTARITYPTVPGQPYATDASSISIGGMTEAGATVTLNQDGVDGSSVSASSADTAVQHTLPYNYMDSQAISPDGGHAVIHSDGSIYLYDLANDTSSLIYETGHGRNQYLSWNKKSDSTVVLEFDYDTYLYHLSKLDIFDGTRTTLLAQGEVSERIYSGFLSPDENTLAYIAYSGLWVKDLASGVKTQLVTGSGSWLSMDEMGLKWSPDGNSIAYYDANDPQGSFNIVNVSTGTVTLIEHTPIKGDLDWSADSTRLFYTARVGSYNAIKRYNVATASSELVQSIDGAHLSTPVLSPDGKLLAYTAYLYNDGSREVRIFDLATAEVKTVLPGTNLSDQWLHWSDVNTLSARIGANYLSIISPAGKFEFNDVRIHDGDNVFAVKATDDNANTSDLSASIVVNHVFGPRADLTFGGNAIVNIPAAPSVGVAARLGVTVSNVGSVDSGASALDAYLIDSAGNASLIAKSVPVPAIAAGGNWATSFVWTTPADAGIYTIVTVVDADDVVAELSEANNHAVRELVVSADGKPDLGINMSGDSYQANQDVAIQVTARNNGDTFSGTLSVAIEDADGYRVIQLVSRQIDDLQYAGMVTVNPLWNTGSTFAGPYQVHARLLDTEQRLVAEQSRPFSIDAGSDISSSIVADRESYPANSDVSLNGSVNYNDGNVILYDLTGTLSISDAEGNRLAEQNRDFAIMMPGGSVGMQMSWNTEQQVPGVYSVTFDLVRGTDLISTSTTNITIEETAGALGGTLSLPQDRVAVGTSFGVSFGVLNYGNSPVTELPVTVAVYEQATQQLVAENELTITQLPVTGTYSGTTGFDSSALTLGGYLVELYAEVTRPDNSVETVNLASAALQVVDRTKPVVTILKPADGGFVPADVLISLTAHDLHSAIAGVALSVDSQEWASVDTFDPGKGIYTAFLGGLADGVHSISAKATDAWGNESPTVTTTFIVDSIKPVVSVTGVQDKQYYNIPVTPQITITDENLAIQRLKLNGAPYVSGTAVTAEGIYVLEAYAEDKTGNASQVTVWFAIDTTPPQITIGGVTDAMLYNTPVTPQVNVTDIHLDSFSATLNGAAYASGTGITADGDYLLTVEARDRAGNTATATLSFAIDATPPVVDVTSPASGAVLNVDSVIVTGTTEPASTVHLSLPGYQDSAVSDSNGGFEFGAVPLAEGDNVMLLYAVDVAGNTGPVVNLPVTVITDEIPPEITVNGVSDGHYYNAVVTPLITITDEHLATREVTLNGASYVSGTPVSAQGAYILEARATDEAGNASQLTVHFTIDTTAPDITLSGVADAELYNMPVTPRVTVSDANPDSYTVTLNDAPYIPGTTITVDGDYLLTVDARDLAGNTATTTLGFVIDTTAPVIEVTSPLNGAVVDNGNLIVSGTTEPKAMVHLSLPGYQDSVLSNALGGFDFADVPLAEGENTISLYAVDAAGNTGPMIALTVTYLKIELTGDIRPPRDVLIYAGNGNHGGKHGHDCKGRGGRYSADTLHHKHDKCSDDDLLDALLALLDEMGIGHYVVDSKSELLRQLRTQRYGTLVILGRGGDLPMYPFIQDEKVRNEILGMVASGMGIAWFDARSDSHRHDEHWQKLFGYRATGREEKFDGIEFEKHAKEFGGSYKASGYAAGIESAGGFVISCHGPSHTPAIILNSYGLGKTLLTTFNPMDIDDASERTELLQRIVDLTRPVRERFVPRDIVEIEWLASNILPPLDVRFDEYIDEDAEFVDTVDGEIVESTHAQWNEDILQQSRKYTAVARWPSTIGDYEITADLSKLANGVPFETFSGTIQFRVETDADTLAGEVLADLTTMEVRHRRDNHALRKAIHNIRRATDGDVSTKHRIEKSIRLIAEALEQLRRMHTDTASVTAKIGNLMRIYQIRWDQLNSDGTPGHGEPGGMCKWLPDWLCKTYRKNDGK